MPSAILAAVFCLAGLSSCSGGVKPPSETSAPELSTEETTTGAYIDTLPATDYNGYEFKIIGQNTEQRQNFYIEEKEGDVVNDAVYERDLAVSERLNISFIYIGKPDRGQVTADVTKAIMADEEAYDLVINSISDGINKLTSSGLLYDLNRVPHISLDSSLWNASMLKNMTFGGRLYFTTGPISPSYLTTPIAMAMNKRLAADYKVGNIYETVLDGKWTQDRLHTLTKDISKDLDNNGTMDKNDFYGLAVDGTFGNVLFNASGIDTVEKSGGKYKLLIGQAKAVELIEKIASKFGDRDAVFNDRDGTGSSEIVFRAGNALFMNYTLLGISAFRDLADDFAIIPTPKYSEDQDSYLTTCNTYLPTGVAIPVNCSDPERSGLIIETMAYYSEALIVPAYYEITLQGKVSRDDDSSKMLDIIYRGSSFDMVTAFNFGGTSVLIREAALGENTSYVSSLASIQESAQAALDNISDFATDN